MKHIRNIEFVKIDFISKELISGFMLIGHFLIVPFGDVKKF